MIGAFVFVTVRSFRNRIALRLRRLREPRYLFSALAGLAYIWMMFLRKVKSRNVVLATFGAGLHAGDLGRDLLSIVILALMIVVWALPSQSGGIEFSEAEILFLFPAPLSRKQLLLYKLFRGLPQTLFSVAVMTIMFGLRQSFGIGLLLAFVVLNIYMMLAAQARARLKLAGFGFLARVTAVLAVLAGLVWLFMLRIGPRGFAEAFRALRHHSTQAAIDAAGAPFRDSVLRAILFVPHIAADAILPAGTLQLFINCLALALAGYAAFLLTWRLNVSFEEASIALVVRRTERQLRDRSGHGGTRLRFSRMPAPFRLSSEGAPEVAIIWKNLTAAMRTSGPFLLLMLLPAGVLVVESLLIKDQSVTMGFGIMALALCGAFPFIGSAAFQQDLRLDLPRLELLKGFPLTGERLVAAELAAPLILTSLGELLMLSGTATILRIGKTHSAGWMAFFGGAQFFILAMLFAIPVCGAQLLIRNAAVIVLPAWTTRSKEEPRGIVMTGQRLLIMAGNLVILAALLLPSAIILGLGFWISHRYSGGGPVAVAFAAAPALALLCGEVYFGVKLLGARFDGIDVSNDFDSLAA